MNQVHRYINFPKKLFNDPISDLEKLIHIYEMKFNKFEMGHFRFPLSEISEKYYSWFHDEFPNIFIKDWEIFTHHQEEYYPSILMESSLLLILSNLIMFMMVKKV